MPSLAEYVQQDPSNLLPFQAELLNSKSSYTLLHGGVGVGKTRVCLWYIFERCLMYPGQTILIGAKTYRQIRDIVLSAWKEEIPDQFYTYNQTQDEITVPAWDGSGESIIRCRSLDRPDKWATTVGSTLTAYYLAQAEQLPEELFAKLESRLRDTGNAHLWFRLYDSNVESFSHWLYRYLVDLASEEHIGKSGASTHQIHTNYLDNPKAFTDTQIETAKRTLGEARFRAEYLGEWGVAPGKAYHLGPEHLRTDSPSGSGRYVLTFDHGYHFSAILIHLVGPWVHVVDERYVEDSSKDSQLNQVKEMLSDNGDPEIFGMCGDIAGEYPVSEEDYKDGIHPGLVKVKSNYWLSKKLDIPLKGTSKSRKPGWDRITELLVNSIDDRPLLTINPGLNNERCKMLRKSLQEAKWDDGFGDLSLFFDHPADSLRYALMCPAFRSE